MANDDNDITLFAKTNFRNREVAFGIRKDDRRRHMYIIGKTGMGKTTLIENMVIQDIQAGNGVAFVDPHGDSVEKVLDYIPSNRVNDVVYLNPADSDFPIAFNPLESVDLKYKHLVASGLMGVFTKIWAGVWSARMEYILNNTILALLDSPGNTLLGIARMLVNKNYRKRIVDNIKDPVVKSFWVDEFANYNDKFRNEAIAPIQNKVGQFLSSVIVRNIVGQTKSSIDLRDIMDNRKIFLINLSKGRIGEDNSALLGAMIITKLQLAAMSRVDMPEEERKDFYLYVDEFQNFATESFANILSEARKYRLNLIVAHQYIGQLVQEKNTVVRDAIFGNVGTLIVFRVGADDAEFLEKEFDPTYLLNDLVNLTKYHIYLKLMINGVSSTPFSATTLAPIAEPTGNVEKVIKVSRERYATERIIVEEKINRWMGSEFHSQAAEAESGAVDQEDLQENLRYQERRTAGNAQQISQSAPAAPRVDRGGEIATEPKWEMKQPQAVKPEQPKPQPAVQPRQHERTERRPERRTHQSDNQPSRRPEKKPSENPVWGTVNKLTTEKLNERVEKTAAALTDLSKTLEESLSTSQAVVPQTVVEPPKTIAPPPLPPPAPVEPIQPIQQEESKSEILQQGTLKPGDKIQF
ncbi:MAG: type IV secretion system DNA-binding domain-containing protein [Candidatus Doudnabacteria bacterium]|nr:type IV secretion system DNA-binding domain-containing protein [Candidatus Doudnabacteria bacterium]